MYKKQKYVLHVCRGIRMWNGGGVVNGGRSIYFILLLFICSDFYTFLTLCRLIQFIFYCSFLLILIASTINCLIQLIFENFTETYLGHHLQYLSSFSLTFCPLNGFLFQAHLLTLSCVLFLSRLLSFALFSNHFFLLL